MAPLITSIGWTLGQSTGGYRPFLDPLNLHDAWWLTLVPLALLVSIAYKAVRAETFDGFWKHALVMAVQVVLAMIGLSIGLYLFVEVIGPMIGS